MILIKRNPQNVFIFNVVLLINYLSNYCNAQVLYSSIIAGDVQKRNNSNESLKAPERKQPKLTIRQSSMQSCPLNNDYPSECSKPADCEDYLKYGFDFSGIYEVWPRNKIMNEKSLHVYCDMDTDGGGWTVLQRRGNYERSFDYFLKDWASYKKGFGHIETDFWLGNDNIFALTNQKLYSVRFDMSDVKGRERYALYDTFFIEDESCNYRLTLEDYSGTAGDSMKGHNKHYFSTIDRDNDNFEGNCAKDFKGAWWYDMCHEANLNGLYLRGATESFADGVVWKTFTGYYESLDETEIKIRSKNFVAPC